MQTGGGGGDRWGEEEEEECWFESKMGVGEVTQMDPAVQSFLSDSGLYTRASQATKTLFGFLFFISLFIIIIYFL